MILLVAFAILASAARTVPPAQAAPPPSVQVQRRSPPPPYDPTADAQAQITAAIKSASTDGIRVLVNWGANDDTASAAFDAARRSRELRPFFSDEYRIVNVNIGHLDKNLDVAKAYGVALTAGALPALTVLDAEGKVLAQTSGAAFRSEADPTIVEVAKVAAFLEKHQAPLPPDAEPLLNAALNQAKADGKSVFVWFSAPW